MKPIGITHYTAVNALGYGNAAILKSLQEQRMGLTPCDFNGAALNTYIGKVDDLPSYALTDQYAKYDCRNNRLANAVLLQDGFADAVCQKIKQYGATRVAVIIGTSTSGVEELEQSYRLRDPVTGRLPTEKQLQYTYNLFSISDYIATRLGAEGPCYTVSTACSSSAKVFAVAARLIQSGLCDAAVVGGVDTLCLNTLHGFNSLQLLSEQPCQPFDKHRKGVSIGEGGGLAFLEKESNTSNAKVMLMGYGESTDAYHMSSPCPDGRGAAASMSKALQSSGLGADQIDYINLHGTGSDINDSSEANAVFNIFGGTMPATATKGYTGHTLGAAGITETVISLLSLENQFLPVTVNTEIVDPKVTINIQTRDVAGSFAAPIKTVMSNSFGFGGNNCSLVFGLL